MVGYISTIEVVPSECLSCLGPNVRNGSFDEIVQYVAFSTDFMLQKWQVCLAHTRVTVGCSGHEGSWSKMGLTGHCTK